MMRLTFNLHLFVLLFAVIVPAAIVADYRYPEMKGVHLRVTASQWPPIIHYTKNADGTITYAGFMINVLNYISEALGTTYSFVFLNETDVNQVGVITAAMNAIVRNEVDLTSTGFVITYERFKAMDLSIPVLTQGYHIAQPYPTEESRLLAPIHPFELMAWLGVLGTLVVMVLVLSSLSGFYRKYFHTASDRDKTIKESLINFEVLSDYTLYMLKIITYKGQLLKISHFSFRLAVGVWCLMAVVLVNIYTGNLFSYLAVPKLNSIPNTFDELADRYPQLQVTIEANSVIAQMFLSAQSGPLKVLGDSLRTNPESAFKTRAGLSKLMSTLKFAYPAVDLLTNPVIAEGYNKENGKCLYTYSKTLYPSKQFMPIVFGLQKNGPYTKAINAQFQDLMDTGLLDQWIKSSMFRVDPCLLRNYNAGAKQKPLSLIDVSCAFLIFGMGIGLAILVVLVEYVMSRIQRKWISKTIRSVRDNKIIEVKSKVKESDRQLVKEK